MNPVTYNWNRLAHRIRERRGELGLTQAEVAKRAGVTPMTVRNLEAGREFRRIPHSLAAILPVLDWEPTSGQDILDGGEPTPRRQTSDGAQGAPARADDRANADAGTAQEGLLPLAVRLAIETGQSLGYDVINFNVAGEPMSVVVMAQTGVYDSEDKRAALREQLEKFGRIKGQIRQEANTPDDSSTTGDD